MKHLPPVKQRKPAALPSLRVRLVLLCVSAICIALCLSLAAFFVLVNNVLGSSVRGDLEFALQETGNNLFIKTTLVEDVLQAVRGDTALSNALSGEGLVPESAEPSVTSAALRDDADLYSGKNIDNLSTPFIDMVYLFDKKGTLNRSTYAQSLTSVQQRIDDEYRALQRSFVAQDTDVIVVVQNAHVNIVYTLYDAFMEPTGTVIFALNRSAIEELMGKTADYKNAFWALFDRTGAPVLQSGAHAMTQTEVKDIAFAQRDKTYEYKLDGTEYLVYTKALNMGLRCALGVPANQISALLYRAVLPYLAVTVLVIVLIGIALFAAIMRMTRPLPEVARQMQRVAERQFEVKLPPYNTTEMNTISATFNSMTDTINHLINHVYEAKLLAMDSEITALQSQINPHFMYNVLHMIALQAKMDGNDDVYKMASNFAGLTQARLSHSGDDKIPLEQELQYVQFYLDLQKFRFTDKLHYHVSVADATLRQCLIPRLMLEMIVENAVMHGIEPKDGPGNVYVDIAQNGADLEILIEDDGVGFAEQDGFVPLPLPQKETRDAAHNHIALNNAYKLLHHFYGGDYGISIQSRQGVGTVVKIRIPKEAAHD